MKTLLLSGLLASTLALPGCLSVAEPTCQSTVVAPITSATGPRTATAGQTVTYNLVYDLGSDCGKFGNFITNTVTNQDGSTTQQVGVNASYNGCSCTTLSNLAQTTYQYQPTKAGTYYVRFLTANSAFITDTLTVQ